MLIVLGKNKKNNSGDTHMNFSGVAAPHITGTTIIEYSKDLHSHTKETTEEYIDHVITVQKTRRNFNDVMVIRADSTR